MPYSKANPIDACIHIINKQTTSLMLLHVLIVILFCAILFLQIGYRTPMTYVSNNYTTNYNHNCQTLYITGIRQGLEKALVSRGFNIECKRWPKYRWSLTPKYADVMCYEYNTTTSTDNVFCNGGILFHLDRTWIKKFANIRNKVALQNTLTQYCTKYHNNDSICDFHLLTYRLDNANERNEFLTKHIDCNNNEPQADKTWVFKENKDKGSGVHIMNNHQLIYQLITANESENINNCVFNPIQTEEYFENEGFVYYDKTVDGSGYVIRRKNCLIQEFVSNPLLLQLPKDTVKHVFHLRSYFMIASYSNPFIVLSFPKPLLYINPNEYNNKGALDKSKILTNRHIADPQNANTEFDMDMLWGNTDFQNYLDVTYGKEHFGGNYTRNKLNNDIKHILKHVFKGNSYENEVNGPRMFEPSNQHHFDMMCADIMITDQFELKLLEINTYCGEHCSKGQIKNKIISDGVYDWDCFDRYDEAAQITMEIFTKKYHKQSIEKIDSLHHYEIVFWE